MDKIEQKICDIIDAHSKEIIEFGRDIWANGETGYQEIRTAGKLNEKLLGLGLETRTEVVVTGVKATLKGNGDKTIGIIGELDALDIKDHPDYNKETGGVHACGHHTQVTALFGAAIALCDDEIRKSLDGNVAFCGIPAEEGVSAERLEEIKDKYDIKYLGGKNEWLRRGEFDDIDIALGSHAAGPIPGFLIVNNSCNGFVKKNVVFSGKSAHAANAAHEGIDAQVAANIAQLALDMQREAFNSDDGISVHSCITQAANSPSTIADKVIMDYVIRAKNVDAIEKIDQKVDDCITAACLATGAGAEIDTQAGYLPWKPLPNTDFVTSVVEKLGLPVMQSQGHIKASSDIGDVSMLKPVLQVFAGGFKGASHGTDFGVTDENIAYVMLSKALALTAYNSLKDGAKEANKMCDEFVAPMTKEEYINYKETHGQVKTIEMKKV